MITLHRCFSTGERQDELPDCHSGFSDSTGLLITADVFTDQPGSGMSAEGVLQSATEVEKI